MSEEMTLNPTEDTAVSGIDLTKLVPYMRKVESMVSGMNSITAPVYMRDFIVGYDVASGMLAKAMTAYTQAKARLESAKSIAYLDTAGTFLASRNIKDTASARDMYTEVDPEVVKAKNEVGKLDALVTFLKNKLVVLKAAHDDVKKAAYVNTDSPNEGM